MYCTRDCDTYINPGGVGDRFLGGPLSSLSLDGGDLDLLLLRESDLLLLFLPRPPLFRVKGLRERDLRWLGPGWLTGLGLRL